MICNCKEAGKGHAIQDTVIECPHYTVQVSCGEGGMLTTIGDIECLVLHCVSQGNFGRWFTEWQSNLRPDDLTRSPVGV